jgi:murein DD-endopeptidase MepM/ murein hydrolase activator NlpD
MPDRYLAFIELEEAHLLMSQNLPSWGKDLDRDDAEDLGRTPDDVDTTTGRSSQTIAWPHRPKRSPLSNRTSRADAAIDDAQQTLNALLGTTPTTGNGSASNGVLPEVISPNGATRNQTRGRIAGPSALNANYIDDSDVVTGYLAGAGENEADVLAPTSSALAIRPSSSSLRRIAGPAPRTQNRLQEKLEQATDQYRIIRERAEVLVGSGPAVIGDEATVQYARRAAARWATRYATHLVIVLVVGALVAMGGLRSLTANSAFDGSLRSLSAETEDAVYDVADFNSPDFEVTLPRTELNAADLDTSDIPYSGQAVIAALVRQHIVVEGDTIASISAAYHVMPETVMGSNKVYSIDEQLKVGSTLTIPPLDGMYYVAAEGDSIESIAKQFSVELGAITGYAANNLSSGQIAPGQGVMVPGGMMPQRYEVLAYKVAPGDSLREVATRYGVDVPTLILSNDIPDPDNLQIGSELRILPVVGAEYKVREGDTLQSIAQRMSVSPEAIIGFGPNRIEASSTLQVGQTLMVPGAQLDWESKVQAAGAGRTQPSVRDSQRPPEVRVTSNSKPAAKTVSKSVSKTKVTAKVDPPVKNDPPKSSTKASTTTKTSNTPKVGTGRMVWPVRGRITQYFTGRHNGLDIAISAGTPIVAADSGKIIWSGWRTDGLGYAVIIDHGNGLTTIYGHMIRQPPVYVGQYVSRGQKIGNIGSTGRSTGPHVHFMVKSGGGRNYRNPLAYLGK